MNKNNGVVLSYGIGHNTETIVAFNQEFAETDCKIVSLTTSF